MNHSDQPQERGVSEVIAFVLVFGIILSSVAVLSVFGFSAMEDYQENEQLQNAERAMSALTENYNDLLRSDGLESRTSDLALRDGRIVSGSDGTELNVTIDNTAIGDTSAFENLSDDEFISLGEFRYETGGDTIGYDGGAVIRSDAQDRSVALEHPQIKCNDRTNTAVVSLMVIDGPERTLSASDTTQFTLRVEERTSEVVDDIEIGVAGHDRYEQAWEEKILEPRDQCLDDADTVLLTIVETSLEF